MPRAEWPLHADRPMVQVVLALEAGGVDLPRRLVADTGAGSSRDVFELILSMRTSASTATGFRSTRSA